MKSKLVKDLSPYETPIIISKDMAIRRIVELIVEHPKVHSFCVVDQTNKLQGLIHRKQIFRAIFSHHVSAGSMVKDLFILLNSERASDLIVKNVLTGKESDSLDKITKLIIEHQLDSVPIISSEGELEGIVTTERLFREWLDQENN